MGVDQLMDGLQCQIWVDGTCAIAEKGCEMMNLSWLAGLQDDGKGSALLCFYKVLMDCGNSQK